MLLPRDPHLTSSMQFTAGQKRQAADALQDEQEPGVTNAIPGLLTLRGHGAPTIRTSGIGSNSMIINTAFNLGRLSPAMPDEPCSPMCDALDEAAGNPSSPNWRYKVHSCR